MEYEKMDGSEYIQVSVCLRPEHLNWIEAQVKSDRFSSVSHAVRYFVSDAKSKAQGFEEPTIDSEGGK